MSEIYLRQGDTYVAMNEVPYEEEKVLQELIEQHPEMLAGEDAPHGALILVKREAGVARREGGSSRWSLDHLYLDATGRPTLVEVKRSADTRSRREVVAQMLDYAAHASISFSAKQVSAWLEQAARNRTDVRSAEDALRKDLGVQDVEQFWLDVDTNLKAERFRLIFVADEIGRTLRRIIEFLNSQMTSTEVLAIEVKQYTDGPDGKHQTVVPRVVGDTAEARAVKRGAQQRHLDRDELVAGFAEHSPDAARAAEGLLDWAERDDRLKVRYTGTGCVFETRRGPLLKLSLYWGMDRSLEVDLITLSKHDPERWDETSIEDLRQRLAGAEIGVVLESRGSSGWKHPKAPVDPLADEDRRRRFEKEMERALATLVD